MGRYQEIYRPKLTTEAAAIQAVPSTCTLTEWNASDYGRHSAHHEPRPDGLPQLIRGHHAVHVCDQIAQCRISGSGRCWTMRQQ
jgi:hypothetical protein